MLSDLVLVNNTFLDSNFFASFHRTYNGQFYSPHPPTHVVISVLKETQAQTLTIINSIKNNVHNPMAKKDRSKIELTIQSYNDYKIHKDIILYLRKIGNSYQGKNLKKNVIFLKLLF